MRKHHLPKVLAVFLSVPLAAFSTPAISEEVWSVYSREDNGDVHYYDESRIDRNASSIKIWQRIQYNTSVMGASSYQGLLEINCSKRTERTLQRTFYSDRDWKVPAMNTDMKVKRKRSIRKNSATGRLSEIVCAR